MAAAPGWYDDGSGTRRYWDGQQWTSETQDELPPPYTPTVPAQQPIAPDTSVDTRWRIVGIPMGPAPAPSNDPRVRQLNGELTIVFWMSLVLGLFGLIPAAIYANSALREGRDASPYWGQFARGLGLAIAIWIVLLLIISSGH